MLKSEYIIAAALFVLGVVFIAASPSITGAVTGNSSGGSIWFSLVGLLFIITASLLLISAKYRVDQDDLGLDDDLHLPNDKEDYFEQDLENNSELVKKQRND